MLQPKYLTVLLCFLLKYIAFFVLLGFMHHRFKTLVIDDAENCRELLTNAMYYVEAILFTMFFFFLPVFPGLTYFIFKISNPFIFLFLVTLMFFTEYLFYTYLASSSNYINGLYNVVSSVLFLSLFFHKEIIEKYRHRTHYFS